MVYSSERRRAYYLSHKEHHLKYSKEYVNRNREKYVEYYKEYNKMKSELAKRLKYKEAQESVAIGSTPIKIPKPVLTKGKKPKGICDVCCGPFKGSFKQHTLTTKHLINEQTIRSNKLKDIKNNIMTSNNIKYFQMFSVEDLKEALVMLGHTEVEDMDKDELYAYIITLINADDIEDDSTEEDTEDEVDYHGLVFKCVYSE